MQRGKMKTAQVVTGLESWHPRPARGRQKAGHSHLQCSLLFHTVKIAVLSF